MTILHPIPTVENAEAGDPAGTQLMQRVAPSPARSYLRLVPRDEMAALVEELERKMAGGIAEPTEYVPTRDRPSATLLERGVYVTPFFWQGDPIVYAIDSHHCQVYYDRWRPGETYEDVVERMWKHLDAHDPQDGPQPVR